MDHLCRKAFLWGILVPPCAPWPNTPLGHSYFIDTFWHSAVSYCGSCVQYMLYVSCIGMITTAFQSFYYLWGCYYILYSFFRLTIIFPVEDLLYWNMMGFIYACVVNTTHGFEDGLCKQISVIDQLLTLYDLLNESVWVMHLYFYSIFVWSALKVS